MRDWSLGPESPLSLLLAADARLGPVDFGNDHIWELTLGGGEPPALALRTTYGLRARGVRLFPRFHEGARTVADPREFATPPQVRRFYPSYLSVSFEPFPGLRVLAEFRVPASQLVAGRLTLTNRATSSRRVRLDWCGQLLPLDGQPFQVTQMQLVNVLAGFSGGLFPVIFLTGGPQPGDGPYPALRLDLALDPGTTRRFTWVQAALRDAQSSFGLARRVAARPWDAEVARLELIHAADTVEIHTGDQDWDAALAIAQSEALRMFFPAGNGLPHPSFVLARNPDHGASLTGDGSDAPPPWSGQTPLDSLFLSDLLPGAPRLLAGVLRNFLAVQQPDGFVDGRPGLAGQRARWLAAPVLASLAWRLHERAPDLDLLREVFPGLTACLRLWFAPAHDRDGDGFPEWDNLLQTGYEDNPSFALWHEWDQAAEISAVESPALGALLCAEVQALENIAGVLGRTAEIEDLAAAAARLRPQVGECYDARAAAYRYRDRDTHLMQAGRVIARKRGDGRLRVSFSSEQPVRLVVQVRTRGGAPRRARVLLREHFFGEPVEVLERDSFRWQIGGAAATTARLYTQLGGIEVEGLQTHDRLVISTLDTTLEDITLLLPLWASLPDEHTARSLLTNAVLNVERFGHPFGLPACPALGSGPAALVGLAVHPAWNALIGHGLLRYGFRAECARLVVRLFNAVIHTLKREHACFQAYDATDARPLGERGSLAGLAPVGLFLETLGVRFVGGDRVRLEGRNPFPWPVTLRYRGLTVIRRLEDTEVIFPDGRSVTVSDPAPCLVQP